MQRNIRIHIEAVENPWENCTVATDVTTVAAFTVTLTVVLTVAFKIKFSIALASDAAVVVSFTVASKLAFEFSNTISSFSREAMVEAMCSVIFRTACVWSVGNFQQSSSVSILKKDANFKRRQCIELPWLRYSRIAGEVIVNSNCDVSIYLDARASACMQLLACFLTKIINVSFEVQFFVNCHS